jgi:hypothetical protein
MKEDLKNTNIINRKPKAIKKKLMEENYKGKTVTTSHMDNAEKSCATNKLGIY